MDYEVVQVIGNVSILYNFLFDKFLFVIEFGIWQVLGLLIVLVFLMGFGVDKIYEIKANNIEPEEEKGQPLSIKSIKAYKQKQQ